MSLFSGVFGADIIGEYSPQAVILDGGGEVTQATDLGGRDNHLVATGTGGLILGTTPGGRLAFDFGGTTDKLQNTSLSGQLATNTRGGFMVLVCTHVTTTNWIADTNSSVNTGMAIETNAGAYRLQAGAGTTQTADTSDTGTPTDDDQILAVCDAGNTARTIYVYSGDTEGSNTNAVSGTFTQNAIYLGGRAGAASIDCHIAYALIVDRAPTAQELIDTRAIVRGL